jgi:hypothetical protein
MEEERQFKCNAKHNCCNCKVCETTVLAGRDGHLYIDGGGPVCILCKSCRKYYLKDLVQVSNEIKKNLALLHVVFDDGLTLRQLMLGFSQLAVDFNFMHSNCLTGIFNKMLSIPKNEYRTEIQENCYIGFDTELVVTNLKKTNTLDIHRYAYVKCLERSVDTIENYKLTDIIDMRVHLSKIAPLVFEYDQLDEDGIPIRKEKMKVTLLWKMLEILSAIRFMFVNLESPNADMMTETIREYQNMVLKPLINRTMMIN